MNKDFLKYDEEMATFFNNNILDYNNGNMNEVELISRSLQVLQMYFVTKKDRYHGPEFHISGLVDAINKTGLGSSIKTALNLYMIGCLIDGMNRLGASKEQCYKLLNCSKAQSISKEKAKQAYVVFKEAHQFNAKTDSEQLDEYKEEFSKHIFEFIVKINIVIPAQHKNFIDAIQSFEKLKNVCDMYVRTNEKEDVTASLLRPMDNINIKSNSKITDIS